jgi:hypothetical protein
MRMSRREVINIIHTPIGVILNELRWSNSKPVDCEYKRYERETKELNL